MMRGIFLFISEANSSFPLFSKNLITRAPHFAWVPTYIMFDTSSSFSHWIESDKNMFFLDISLPKKVVMSG